MNKLIRDDWDSDINRHDSLSRFYFSVKVIPPFVRLFLKTNLTPNQITCLSFACYILAGLCFCYGKYLHLIIGAAIIQLGLILDNVDGIIARTKSLTSTYGKWLDDTAGLIGIKFMIFCAGLGMFNYSKNLTHLYVGMIGSMIVVFKSFAMQRALIIKPKRFTTGLRERVDKKIGINILAFLTGGGADLIWLSVGAFLNLMYYVFILYFTLFCGFYLVRIFIVHRKHLRNDY